jgi:Spy/CpxP family protein refolding chaperone
MIGPKLGMLMLLAGAAGLAQQPPPLPQTPQPPAVQAPRQAPVTEAERRRFEEIRARRDRGEPISPEDQRFAQEIMARPSRPPSPAAAPQPPQPARPPLERALGMPEGRWWTRPEAVQKLGLTADQTKKMDEIFQQYRLKSIDLNAVVQKEEAIMEPLISAEQPDEAKIVAQIDRISLARAELEKANTRMLLGIRRLLTPEQLSLMKSALPVAPQPMRR